MKEGLLKKFFVVILILLCSFAATVFAEYTDFKDVVEGIDEAEEYAPKNGVKLEVDNELKLYGESLKLKNGTTYVDALEISKVFDLEYSWQEDLDRLMLRQKSEKYERFMYFTDVKKELELLDFCDGSFSKSHEPQGYLTTEMLDEEEDRVLEDKMIKSRGRTLGKTLSKRVYRSGYMSEGNKVYVPIKELALQLSYEVDWDPYSKSVLVYTNGRKSLPIRSIFRIPFTDEDLLWLARIAFIEARGGSEYKKLAVCNVVLNRVEDPRFEDTVKGVILQPGQFPPAHTEGFSDIVPSDDALRAARRALYGENNIPGVLFFNMVPFTDKSEDEFYGEIEGDYFYY